MLVTSAAKSLLTLDRSLGHGLSYPAGSDTTAIRRTMLLKNCLIRWLSASKANFKKEMWDKRIREDECVALGTVFAISPSRQVKTISV